MLGNVTEVKEFSIYSGVEGETDLTTSKLLSCAFCLPHKDFKEIEIPKEVCEKLKFE